MPFSGTQAAHRRRQQPAGWSADAGVLRSSAPSGRLIRVVIADADGANERTLAARKLPAQFLSFGSRGTPSRQVPAFTRMVADGKVIALIGFATIDKV